MRILIITNSSGGLYSFRKMLLEELISDGHELFALTPINEKKEELEELGVSLVDIQMDRRGINPIKDVSLLIQYKKRVDEINPELIITYTIKPNVYGGIVSRITRTDYAANITGLGTAFEKRGLIKILAVSLNRIGLKKARIVFFENEANLNYFVKEGIIISSQAHQLHGAGVDVNHFNLQKYPEDGSEFKFLFIGRIMREKGFVELIDALKQLRSDGVNCSLSVLGTFDEADLQDIVDKYSAEGWLHYYGVQADVRPFIERSHCFVLPSYHEGMANTNLESAACGRPVITSNVPGCKEAVVEGVTGYLCEVKDTDSLYRAMLKMCKLSMRERETMGMAGREHIERVFDKRKVVEETIKALMQN